MKPQSRTFFISSLAAEEEGMPPNMMGLTITLPIFGRQYAFCFYQFWWIDIADQVRKLGEVEFLRTHDHSLAKIIDEAADGMKSEWAWRFLIPFCDVLYDANEHYSTVLIPNFNFCPGNSRPYACRSSRAFEIHGGAHSIGLIIQEVRESTDIYVSDGRPYLRFRDDIPVAMRTRIEEIYRSACRHGRKEIDKFRSEDYEALGRRISEVERSAEGRDTTFKDLNPYNTIAMIEY